MDRYFLIENKSENFLENKNQEIEIEILFF